MPSIANNESAAADASWAPAYPVLLDCLSHGRRPSPGEVERLAARMWRELGHASMIRWHDLAPASARRTRMLALAKLALHGRQPPLASALVATEPGDQ